ncbi:HlyC/CorC family transporter [bacterium]|nr:MAG: HlyC/CorC family transporter [bacterium]
MDAADRSALEVLAWAALSIGVVSAAVGAAADTALDVANRVRLRGIAERARPTRRAVRRLIDEPDRAWLAARTLVVAGLVLAGAGGGIGLGGTGRPLAQTVVLVGALALAVIVAGDLLPRGWAARQPETAALVVAPAIDAVALIVAPLAPLARRLGIEPPEAHHGWRDDELRTLLNVDDEDGPIEADEAQMIVGIMELGETQAHEIMVPRIDIVAIPITATLDEALDTIIAAGHSRIPVYGETIDDIRGLLYAKDLLKTLRNRDFGADIAGFLREPRFVPESKPVDALLADLQSHQVHMAIVVDEYGGTAGLVTIEDLLEEIVGEIQDEYDVEEPRMVRVSDDEAIFNAGLNIYDVNRMMGIHLPTDNVNTLAGLVLTGLGRVPERADRVRFDDADIEVLDLLGRRVHRVRVTRREPGTDAGPEAPGPSVPGSADA